MLKPYTVTRQVIVLNDMVDDMVNERGQVMAPTKISRSWSERTTLVCYVNVILCICSVHKTYQVALGIRFDKFDFVDC